MSGFNVTPYPYELFNVLGLPITNSFVMSVGVSILIAVGINLAIGKPSVRPNRVQATLEVMLEALQGVLKPVLGEKMLRATFPLLIGFFFFILIQNWAGLLPGVGTMGIVDTQEGTQHLTYFLRPPNTDLTNTAALGLLSFGAWLFYVIKYAGIKHFAQELFGNKADPASLPKVLYYAVGIIFFLVGFIEIISILIRPISLSFRLFGNMFGGENLLMNITGLSLWLIPVPIYFLEVLIGLVQAFVFTLLSAVYIGLVCNHHEDKKDNKHGTTHSNTSSPAIAGHHG